MAQLKSYYIKAAFVGADDSRLDVIVADRNDRDFQREHHFSADFLGVVDFEKLMAIWKERNLEAVSAGCR